MSLTPKYLINCKIQNNPEVILKDWNFNKQTTNTPEGTTLASSVEKCQHQTCPQTKCTPPQITSCSTSAAKNICVYEPSPLKLKPCAPAKPDPDWKMAESEDEPEGPRVIILGAGFAGLTAADRLIKAGHSNLIVLEADCRAGGRLKSRWAGDTVVELGFKLQEKSIPSWDHPLMKLGLADGLFPPPSEGDPSSGLLNHPLPLPLIFKTYTFLQKLINEELCSGHTRGYIGLRFRQAGGNLPATYRNQTARILAAASSFMGPKLKVEENSFGAFAIAPGGVRIPLGESGHLIPLLESVGDKRILYRKEAVSIRWGTVTLSQKPRVIVRCRDGSEYHGEFIIISCSLGSLKSSMDSMFYPPLPTKKAAAIQNIGYEQQNMAYLIFDDPIWTWSPRPVEMTLSNKDVKDANWTNGIREIRQVPGSQHVIGVQVVGQGAVKLEHTSNEDVMAALHSVLEKALFSSSVPMPKDVVRSGWSSLRYFGGSHSSCGSAQLRADLAAPLPSPDQLPPILLFAGEATCEKPGLRAAILSGLREAERLLSIFGSFPKPKEDVVCPVPCPTK